MGHFDEYMPWQRLIMYYDKIVRLKTHMLSMSINHSILWDYLFYITFSESPGNMGREYENEKSKSEQSGKGKK